MADLAAWPAASEDGVGLLRGENHPLTVNRERTPQRMLAFAQWAR